MGSYTALAEFFVDLPLFPYACIKGPTVRIKNLSEVDTGPSAVVRSTHTNIAASASRHTLAYSPNPYPPRVAALPKLPKLPNNPPKISDRKTAGGGHAYSLLGARVDPSICTGHRGWRISRMATSHDNCESSLHDPRLTIFSIFRGSTLMKCAQCWTSTAEEGWLTTGTRRTPSEQYLSREEDSEVQPIGANRLPRVPRERPREISLGYGHGREHGARPLAGLDNTNAWLIGRHRIKAQINPLPTRKRHQYYVTSFEKVPGNPCGNGLPDLLADISTVANATLRALVNNLSIGERPASNGQR